MGQNFVSPITSDIKLTHHFIKNSIIPMVKHGGSVMVWGNSEIPKRKSPSYAARQ